MNATLRKRLDKLDRQAGSNAPGPVVFATEDKERAGVFRLCWRDDDGIERTEAELDAWAEQRGVLLYKLTLCRDLHPNMQRESDAAKEGRA